MFISEGEKGNKIADGDLIAQQRIPAMDFFEPHFKKGYA
jgi:hypothetical protein